MSRSYKKHPYVTDGTAGSTKRRKRRANKVVRNNENLPNGSAYKKAYETWDIHDYISRWTWEEAKEAWERGDNEYLKKHYPTLKEYYRYWLKCSKLK